MATFASPSADGERLLDLLGRRARRRPDDAPDPGAELVVRRRDVDHEVAERLAEADHRDRREHVEDELLGRSRLEARRAGEELGADLDDDRVLDGARRARSRATETTHAVSAPAAVAARTAPSAYGVRPLALTATTKSSARRSRAATSAAPRVAVVLGRLLLERRRVRAAGKERDDLPRGSGEGRLAFGCVERRDASGGAGADVDQAPATAQGLGDRLGDGGDLPRGRRDCGGDGLVLRVHQLDELDRRAQVVVRLRRAPGLGRELVEARVGRSRRIADAGAGLDHEPESTHSSGHWSIPLVV